MRAINGFKICCRKDCDLVGEPQPVKNFYKCKGNFDGYQGKCIVCEKEYQEKFKKRKREYDKGRSFKNKKYKQDYQQSPQRRMSSYISSAKKRNLVFELSFEQFKKIVFKRCYYCGQFSENKDFCGIDRVDNNVGYTLENCVSCCDICNEMKMARKEKEFLKHIEKIYLYRGLYYENKNF